MLSTLKTLTSKLIKDNSNNNKSLKKMIEHWAQHRI